MHAAKRAYLIIYGGPQIAAASRKGLRYGRRMSRWRGDLDHGLGRSLSPYGGGRQSHRTQSCCETLEHVDLPTRRIHENNGPALQAIAGEPGDFTRGALFPVCTMRDGKV